MFIIFILYFHNVAEEQSKDSNVKSTIEAVTGLVKAVPLYDDAIQPAAKQVGKSLETLSKAINIALLPVSGLVWGYEKIDAWLTARLAQKLNHVSISKIVSPFPQIAGPSLEALRFIAHDDTLRELFANLLATSMDSSIMHLAHPSYVEILKNLCTDEAIILKLFIVEDMFPTIDLIGKSQNSEGGYVYYSNFTVFHRDINISRIDLIPSYIDNLCRLGLIELSKSIIVDDTEEYEDLIGDNYLEPFKAQIIEAGLQIGMTHSAVVVTTFGRQFVDNVVRDKPE